ncbi:unnamed protein product [Urochloa humidicola]
MPRQLRARHPGSVRRNDASPSGLAAATAMEPVCLEGIGLPSLGGNPIQASPKKKFSARRSSARRRPPPIWTRSPAVLNHIARDRPGRPPRPPWNCWQWHNRRCSGGTLHVPLEPREPTAAVANAYTFASAASGACNSVSSQSVALGRGVTQAVTHASDHVMVGLALIHRGSPLTEAVRDIAL